MTESEHAIQNKIRLAVSAKKAGTLFRANVGTGFQGHILERRGGSLVLEDARPFQTGLPKGFPDLFGIKPIKITKEMIGQTIGAFIFLEVKTRTGKLRKEQEAVIHFLQENGAIGGVARSPAEAIDILEGGRAN